MASAPGGVGLLLKRCLAVSVAPFTTVEDDSYIASRVREGVGRNLRRAVDALLRDALGTLPRSTGRRVTIKTPAEMRADDDRAARVSNASVRSRRSWSSAASLARVWTRLSRARRAPLDVSTRRLARTCEGAPRVSSIGPRLMTRREHSWAEFRLMRPVPPCPPDCRLLSSVASAAAIELPRFTRIFLGRAWHESCPPPQ
jgi:hypothetical protein